jgi:hypothetical protein
MTEEAGSEMAALRAELLTLRRVVDQQTSDQRALNTALVTGDKRLDEMRQRFVETMAERDLRLKERHDLEGLDHPVHEHRVERRPGLHVQRHELDARGLTASSTGTVHG